MVGLRIRCAEDGHDGVADELVDRTLVLEDDVGHAREVLVQQLSDVSRGHALGKAGEADDVREQHRRVELLHVAFALG